MLQRALQAGIPKMTDELQQMQEDTLLAAPSMYVGDHPEGQLLRVHLLLI